MSGSIFVATRNNLADLRKVMDNGFRADPTVQWILHTPEYFESEHHKYVELCAEPAFDHRAVHVTIGFDGAAIWYPPGIGISDESNEEFKKQQFSQIA